MRAPSAASFERDDAAAAEFDVVWMRPNARIGANSGWEIGVGFIVSLDEFALDVFDARRVPPC